jgi:hypothetical protein
MQFLAGAFYKQSNEMKKYSLNCLGIIHKYFESISGWNRSKEFINMNIGELCLNLEYYLGSLKFFKNCLELSKNRSNDQEQALFIRYSSFYVDTSLNLLILYKVIKAMYLT